MAIELISEIKQKNNGKFPLIDSNNIRGGLYQVKTKNEMESIPEERLKPGTLCYVQDHGIYFKYSANNVWSKYNDSLPDIQKNDIPILDQGMIGESDPSELPEKYISIPEDEIHDGEVTNNIYTTTNNGNYIDILFSAIRSLLSEVARLKNSFKYGINSYNDDKTAMSTALNEITVPDEEPLWAVEEDSLSELYDCTISMDKNHNLIGDVEVDNNNGVLNINSSAYFKDPEENGFKDQADPKSFIFLTATSKDIIVNFKTLEENSDDNFNIDLNNLTNKKYSNSNVEKYNILIIVSKKTTKSIKDVELYGDNYIWLLISDYKTDDILINGYYNKTNELISTPYSLSSLKGYYINSIEFKNLVLSKFNSYTKYLDFSQQVIPNYPDDSDYKFNAAHITIRSVKNINILNNLIDYLLNNELIWIEDNKKLCIKSKNKLIEIGSNNKQDDDSMTTQELITELEHLGIVTQEGGGNLKLNDVSKITFIHQDTGKKFNIQIDAEGNLRSTLLGGKTIEKRLAEIKLPEFNTRGFISNLLTAEARIDPNNNAGLKSDRLKIGAIYAPQQGRKIFGCSHAYIELENTSDSSFNLEGCYLHAAITTGSQENKNTKIYSLPLTGTIESGGTYLIRGKKYSEFDDNNTVIKVETYDLEWYDKDNKLLVDFQSISAEFLLIYGESSTDITGHTYIGKNTSDAKKWTIKNPYFIDYAPVRDRITQWSSDANWDFFDEESFTKNRDYILKNTFELDPAKLAFQALYSKDSSRVRGLKDNDFKPLFIDNPIISFPHSKETYDVSKYTPKASFEHKNVSTDKSKLNKEKPNMVYCSFGIDMHKTRCFNWISVGSFDEYIWVRTKGTLNWERFESYKDGDGSSQMKSIFSRKAETEGFLNCIYKRMQGRFPGDGSFYTAHKCILELNNELSGSEKQTFEYCVGRSLIDNNPDPNHTSEIMQFTIYPKNTSMRIYLVTDLLGFNWIEYQTWAGSAEVIYNKIKEDLLAEKTNKGKEFIPVIINTGDMTQNGTRVNEWLDYYRGGYCLFKEFEHMSVVGNNDLCNTDPAELGTGDDYGKSNGYYHHLFQCFEVNDPRLIINEKYVPSTYYIECQSRQDKIEKLICVNSEITFINCRDWFGLQGQSLSSAYNIYTGWLVGEDNIISSPQYKTDSWTPIYNVLYDWFLDTKNNNKRTIVACHEMPFTVMTNKNLQINPAGCRIYSRSIDGSSPKLVGSHLNQINEYDNIANYWFSRLLEWADIKLCIGGHKHTYTCSYPVREFYFYKTKDGNLNNSLQNGPMTMEPTLENENDLIDWNLTSDSPILKNILTCDPSGNFDNSDDPTHYKVFFNPNDFHTSRLPLVKFNGTVKKISGNVDINYSDSDLNTDYLPIIGVPNLQHGVVYFMCLATGYKLSSNKELPSSAQAFTQLLPLTVVKMKSDGTQKEEPSIEQQLPMFGIIKLDETIDIQLLSVHNIQIGKAKPLYNDIGWFAPVEVKPKLQYMNCMSDKYIEQRYGKWVDDERSYIMNIN